MPSPNIIIAMERQPPAKGVKVARYQCKATGRELITNRSKFPWSPFAGKLLTRVSADSVQMPLEEITGQMVKIGRCKTCISNHFAMPNRAKKLIGKKLHCVVCNEPFTVQEPKTVTPPTDDEDVEISLASDDNDDNNDALMADDNDDNEAVEGDDDNDNNDADADDNNEAVVAEEHPKDKPAADNVPEDTKPPVENKETQPPVDTKPPAEDNKTETEDKADEEKDEDKDDETEETGISDLVSANTSEFVINCFERAGGLANKQSIRLLPATKILAFVLADDQPVMRLDAEKAGDNAELFERPDALKKAFEAIIDENPEAVKSVEAFATLGASAITHTVKIDAALQERVKAGVIAVTASVTDERSRVGTEWRQALSIASLMLAKNADPEVENPLYNTLHEKLGKLNIRNPATLLNTVMAASMEPLLRSIISEAQKIMEMPIEARNERARFVEKMQFRTIAGEGNPVDHKKAYSDDSVHVSTAGLANEDDAKPPVTFGKEVVATGENNRINNFRSILTGRAVRG